MKRTVLGKQSPINIFARDNDTTKKQKIAKKNQLRDDEWSCVLQFFDLKTLASVCNVNKCFYEAITENKILKKWDSNEAKEAIRVRNIVLMKCLVAGSSTLNFNELFYCACRYNCLEIVKFLLQDPRVDPGANENASIRTTISRGHDKIVKLLLQDPRVNPYFKDKETIINVVFRYQEEIEEIQSQKKKKCSGRVTRDWPFQSIKQEYYEILKLLLQDGRADPTEQNNKAIRTAIKYGHTEIVELLVQDKRIRSTVNVADAIKTAQKNAYGNYWKSFWKD